MFGSSGDLFPMMSVITLVFIGFFVVIVAIIVVVIVFAVVRNNKQKQDMSQAQNELAQLEGRRLAGQQLSEQEAIRLVQLQNQVQDIRDERRNSAITLSGGMGWHDGHF